MNWGKGLFIVFVAFALLIGGLVYGAMHTKYELVNKDYYRDELRYQEKIDGEKNAAVAGYLAIIPGADSVRLRLPESLQTTKIKADAWFYCRNNSAFDRRNMIEICSGQFAFDRKYFAAAKYELKLQFESGGKLYYYSQPLDLR